MKIRICSSAIALTFFMLACKSSNSVLQDVSHGAQYVGNTARQVNSLATNTQRAVTTPNRAPVRQPSTARSNQRNTGGYENPRSSTEQTKVYRTREQRSRSEKVEFIPKCISGDCENGTGVKEYEYLRYEGQFKNGKHHGYGKLYSLAKVSTLNYYEGNFANGLFHGKVTQYERNGTVYQLIWNNGYVEGLGVRIKEGLSNLGYWNSAGEMIGKGLTFTQLKVHQDSTFAKFKKCNCLERKDFNLPTGEWVDVPHEEMDPYTGEKNSRTSMELKVNHIPIKGHTNNRDYIIYVRGYIKKYYKDRNVYEYIDNSFIARPGDKLMANYRQQPLGLISEYLAESYVYLGQYCRKEIPNTCK